MVLQETKPSEAGGWAVVCPRGPAAKAVKDLLKARTSIHQMHLQRPSFYFESTYECDVHF